MPVEEENNTLYTEVTDHTGQGDEGGSTCTPVTEIGSHPEWAKVNPECVEGRLTLGEEQGVWIPGINDCQTFVRDVLNDCSPPSASDIWRERLNEYQQFPPWL